MSAASRYTCPHCDAKFERRLEINGVKGCCPNCWLVVPRSNKKDQRPLKIIPYPKGYQVLDGKERTWFSFAEWGGKKEARREAELFLEEMKERRKE